MSEQNGGWSRPDDSADQLGWRDPYGASNQPGPPVPSAVGNPYDQPQPYGRSPYVQQPYAQPPYPVSPYPVYGGYPGAFAVPQQNGMAIAALVTGIASVIFIPVAGIAAIILGAVTVRRTSSDPVRYGGRGLGVAGIILGGVGCVIGVSLVIFYIWFFHAYLADQ